MNLLVKQKLKLTKESQNSQMSHISQKNQLTTMTDMADMTCMTKKSQKIQACNKKFLRPKGILKKQKHIARGQSIT